MLESSAEWRLEPTTARELTPWLLDYSVNIEVFDWCHAGRAMLLAWVCRRVGRSSNGFTIHAAMSARATPTAGADGRRWAARSSGGFRDGTSDSITRTGRSN